MEVLDTSVLTALMTSMNVYKREPIESAITELVATIPEEVTYAHPAPPDIMEVGTSTKEVATISMNAPIHLIVIPMHSVQIATELSLVELAKPDTLEMELLDVLMSMNAIKYPQSAVP